MEIKKDLVDKRLIYEAWPAGGIYDAVVLNVTKTGLVHLSFEHNGGGRIWIKPNDLQHFKLLEIIPKARAKRATNNRKPRISRSCRNCGRTSGCIKHDCKNHDYINWQPRKTAVVR